MTRLSDETARKLFRHSLREQNRPLPRRSGNLALALFCVGLAAWIGYAVWAPF